MTREEAAATEHIDAVLERAQGGEVRVHTAPLT